MNRVIKFRGKRIDNGKWIYGYYFYSLEHKRHLILPHDSVDAIPVDPKTVGQFTGVKDKAQKEIYEGDFEINNGFTWIVKYVGTSFVLVDKSGQRIAALDADTFTFVAGNIHETL